MHIYDYTFLEHFPLPDDPASLLRELHRADQRFTRRVRRSPHAYAAGEASARASSLEAVRLIEAVELPGYVQAMDEIREKYADTVRDGDVFLHILARLLPEAAPLSEEKSQAVRLAVSAYYAARERSIDPFLLIPCLTLDLICTLSPRHGAHEAALVFAQLLLSQSGSNICRYSSLEAQVGRYCSFYCQALGHAQVHWAENGNAYLPYMEIFLSLLYLCYQGLPKPSAGKSQRGSKRAAVESLVLNCEKPISKSEICAALPSVSPTTVEAVLGVMVKSGTVRRVGAARAARYIKAAPQ